MQFAIHLSLRFYRFSREKADVLVGPYHERILTPLKEKYAAYLVKEQVPGGLVFRSPDLRLIDELQKWMDGSGSDYQIVFYGLWNIDELVRARWTILLGGTAWDFKVQNHYPILCPICSWIDETKVPNPYRIEESPNLKKYEIFSCKKGLIAVNRRVRDLLLEAVSGEFQCGTVEVVSANASAVQHVSRAYELYWVRPVHRIGSNIVKIVRSPCPACGVPVEYQDMVDAWKKKVFSRRTVVEHFGDPSWNIACLGNWTGNRKNDHIFRLVVFSGGLVAYLFNHKVKGLGIPDEGLYSAKDEPIIEEKRRFDVFSPKEDRVLRQKMCWQKEEERERLASLPPQERLERDKGVSGHIFRHFRDAKGSILHELIPLSDVHVDIHVIEPTAERNFYTLITEGMSSHKMNVPTGEDAPLYTELVSCLPPDWKIAVPPEAEDANFSWPITWLHKLALYSSAADTWLAEGHTVADGDPPEPMGPNTNLCCWLIRKPRLLPDSFQILQKGKKAIRFYAVVPIYREEMDYEKANGYEALAKLLDANGITELLNVNRPNVCAKP